MSRSLYHLLALGLLALMGAYALGPGASAQRAAESVEMKSPMVTGLAGVCLYADCPAALLARADELDLDLRQRRQLEEIEVSARQQARKLLSDGQWEQLSKASQGKLTMPELARLGMRGKKTVGHCPACMKAMQAKSSADAVPQPEASARFKDSK